MDYEPWHVDDRTPPPPTYRAEAERIAHEDGYNPVGLDGAMLWIFMQHIGYDWDGCEWYKMEAEDGRSAAG